MCAKIPRSDRVSRKRISGSDDRKGRKKCEKTKGREEERDGCREGSGRKYQRHFLFEWIPWEVRRSEGRKR